MDKSCKLRKEIKKWLKLSESSCFQLILLIIAQKANLLYHLRYVQNAKYACLFCFFNELSSIVTFRDACLVCKKSFYLIMLSVIINKETDFTFCDILKKAHNTFFFFLLFHNTKCPVLE